MKKHYNIKLVITKEDDEHSENSPKCWICDDTYVDGDVEVRYHHHITGKYKGSAYRDCNINIRINHKIPIVFHNLMNYGSHLLMLELGKLYFKINKWIRKRYGF